MGAAAGLRRLEAGKLPDHLTGRAHPAPAICVPGHSWFSVGPALLLVLLDAQRPEWSDWPVYALAILAQIAFDLLASHLREWAGRGLRRACSCRPTRPSARPPAAARR